MAEKDYTYMPAIGPLPGKSFEHQTTQFFNELQTGQDTNTEAIQNTQEALSEAEAFVEQTVSELQADFAVVEEKANTASSRATQAYEKATSADQTAQAAQTTATNALNVANSKWTAQDATISQKGIVQLSNATTGTSQTLAATEKAVSDALTAAKTYADGASTTGNAATATKLATARSLKTDLASSTAVTFDGSADQNAIPVTGVLPVTNGGTGSSTQNFVDLTTNQTVGGIKTFSSSPVVPDAANNGEAVNKGQLDTVDNSAVHKTGNETIGGNKTFTSPIIVDSNFVSLKQPHTKGGSNGLLSPAWFCISDSSETFASPWEARLFDIAQYIDSNHANYVLFRLYKDVANSNDCVTLMICEPLSGEPTLIFNGQNITTDDKAVHKTGDETIAGTKTFTSSPVVPTPAANDDSTNTASTAFVKNALNASLLSTCTTSGSWSISGCTIGKTLYIVTYATDPPADSIYAMSGAWGSGPVTMFIPTATTVVLNVPTLATNTTLRAYQ